MHLARARGSPPAGEPGLGLTRTALQRGPGLPACPATVTPVVGVSSSPRLPRRRRVHPMVRPGTAAPAGRPRQGTRRARVELQGRGAPAGRSSEMDGDGAAQRPAGEARTGLTTLHAAAGTSSSTVAEPPVTQGGAYAPPSGRELRLPRPAAAPRRRLLAGLPQLEIFASSASGCVRPFDRFSCFLEATAKCIFLESNMCLTKLPKKRIFRRRKNMEC